jgi:hypothetical protein
LWRPYPKEPIFLGSIFSSFIFSFKRAWELIWSSFYAYFTASSLSYCEWLKSETYPSESAELFVFSLSAIWCNRYYFVLVFTEASSCFFSWILFSSTFFSIFSSDISEYSSSLISIIFGFISSFIFFKPLMTYVYYFSIVSCFFRLA